MRVWLGAAFGLILFLAGCAYQEPKLRLEPQVLDSIPVVPLQTECGLSTALLDEGSVLVTVSHGLPRRQRSGPADVLSARFVYTVDASGDELEQEWSVWNSTIARLGQGRDWAKLSLTPPLNPGDVFNNPMTVTWSNRPPAVGEHMVLIGYTRDKGKLERFWAPVEIIDVPDEYRQLDAGHHVWFRTLSRTGLKDGFSGAPLLRQREDGGFEVSAMVVSAKGKRGDRKDIGVGIVVPKSK